MKTFPELSQQAQEERQRFMDALGGKATLRIASYTGRLVGPHADSPSLQDISVQLGRVCRYAGAGVKFWSVLLHSMVVADLIDQPELKIYGLLHDSTEGIVGDIPRGFKPAVITEVEDFMFDQILESFGLPKMTPEIHRIVKFADNEALAGEVWTVGTSALQQFYTDRSKRAEELVLKYAKEFPPETTIHPDGIAVIEFVSRFRDYSDITKG
jgi:hypothetical protein